MSYFSNQILKRVQKHFPKLKWKVYEDADSGASFSVKRNSAIGGLAIQITPDSAIWLRIYPSYSSYSIDTINELVRIIEGVLEDKILWVIGFKAGQWVETTLSNSVNGFETEEGVRYKIYSWSGVLDCTVKG